MGKFRKPPVEVEAEKVSDLCTMVTSNWSLLPEWVRVAYDSGKVVFANNHIIVTTGTNSVGAWDDYLINENGSLKTMNSVDFLAEHSPVVTDGPQPGIGA